MAYREQEKQQDKNRNAQRKLKVEIVERSCSDSNETMKYTCNPKEKNAAW